MTKIKAEKIKVTNRIRKEYGNLQSLADDIRENGLINPPVIAEGTNELIAGERRLKAMSEILGWTEIPVRYVNVRDEEHRLKMEISENEERKDFSKAERIDWARRLERIESIKAAERRKLTQNNNSAKAVTQNFAEQVETGETAAIVAEKAGIGSKENYRKEKYIVDHQESLTPEDFADWDEGRLSTNKAFNKIKEALKQVNSENKSLKSELAVLKSQPTNTNDEIIHQLKQQLAEAQSKLENITVRLDETEAENDRLTLRLTTEGADPSRATKISAAGALEVKMEEFVKALGSIRYSNCMQEIESNEAIRDSMINIIQNVEQWLADVKPLVVPEIIDSTAIDVEEHLTTEERFNRWAEREMRKDLFLHDRDPQVVADILESQWNSENPNDQIPWNYVTLERAEELLAIPANDGIEEAMRVLEQM